MNLILLSTADFLAPDVVRLSGRRWRHIAEIIRPALGDTLTVGLENGLMGRGIVGCMDEDSLELQVTLDRHPPAKLPFVLCLALMRPIVLRRVLATAAAMGVPDIILFHSQQVEKSFWQSSSLKPEAMREHLVLGLEQAKDTVLPRVTLCNRFKPFVEDTLSGFRQHKDSPVFVADPSGEPMPAGPGCRARVPGVIIIGPEGGFIPFELAAFRAAGCRMIGLGERVLKVETAMVALLAKFF